ncbi:hypothetical protein LSH36_68g06012 [Paralvinella palmiformis]|uniref:Tropomodulin n=1 Tax=Paralvinella palmiformis TaxID=53620 RepID=A0AAD9K3Z5_9ANNE|nr:hypothetical protein LSH36_68g06012 [Paralvinella palmiformis]
MSGIIERPSAILYPRKDSCIPPSERCRYKTDKKPSGPFNRKALLDYLEKKAREEKDWDEVKPYKKEVRGKIWKPKEQPRVEINDDIQLDTEWDEVLASATEEELVDLAAILGFHGMLNQTQYHQAFVENKEILGGGGFQGVAKYQEFKVYDEEPPNDTDVDKCLKQVKDNDPKLTELNINNMKNISMERLLEFGKAIGTNSHLEKFSMANTNATDKVAMVVAESLKTNKTLSSLNMESNYISGRCILMLLEAINVNKKVIEFKIANQRPVVLGHKVEMRIAELIRENINILRLGIFLEGPARVMVQEFLKRNHDNGGLSLVSQCSYLFVDQLFINVMTGFVFSEETACR